jgi:hypothetical protein
MQRRVVTANILTLLYVSHVENKRPRVALAARGFLLHPCHGLPELAIASAVGILTEGGLIADPDLEGLIQRPNSTLAGNGTKRSSRELHRKQVDDV